MIGVLLMAVLTSTTSFQVSTGIAGTIQNIPFGMQAKFVRWKWNGQTSAVNASDIATHQRGMGVSIDTAFGITYDDYSVTTKDQNAVSPSNSATDTHENEGCHTIDAATNTSDGSFRVTAWNATSVDIIITNQFSAGITIIGEAFGGDGIKRIASLVTTEPVATGNVNMVFPFTPDFIYQISNPSGAVTTGISDDSRMGMGACAFRNAGIQQFACAMGANDNVATTDTQHSNRGDKFIQHIDTNFSGTLTGQASVTSRNGSTVVLNWDIVSGGGNREHIILAIEGGEWAVGSFDTVAAGNPITVTPGFKPKGGSLYSVNRPETASGVTGSIDEWTVGGFDSASNQRSMTVESDDGVATSEVTRCIQFDSVYVGSNGNGAVDARITLTSIDLFGVTLQQVTSDFAGRKVYYDMVGDEIPPFLHRDDYTRLRM